MVRTIKILQTLLVLSGLCLGMNSYAAIGGGGGDNNGGSTPWPWGFEVNFPWNDVQGIWRIQKDDQTLYFSFRRVQSKRIKIKQIDIATCQVIGAGQGLERDKTIVAQIHNIFLGETYNLTIYAFHQEDLQKQTIVSPTGSADHVIVGRINSLDLQGFEFAAQMVRISDRLEVRCGNQEKKTKF